MEPVFQCEKTEPVVETRQGKIRGFRLNRTYTFHGIPYAKARRFQMPEPVEPWKGIKDALSYGYVCPLLNQDEPNMEVLVPHRYWPQDEDCLNLNIWTGSLDPKAKKPVMVWLHGGAFAAGSSIEQVAYEGDHLSQYGDVVVVTVNHRLNILGYLDLSPFGEKYRNSANAGTADLVAALTWVHENIENFGGDPENVTIFGQSGGGMKVVTLLNTPAADGLFQKGIIESGVYRSQIYGKEDGDGTEIVTALLKELGLSEGEVEKLETISFPELSTAYRKVEKEVKERGCYTGQGPMQNEYFLGDPLLVGFSEHAKTIPVLAGTVLGEFDFGPVVPGKHEMTRKEALIFLSRKYGGHAEELLEEFEKAYPDKCPADLWSVDMFFRPSTVEFIQKKSAVSKAPVYSYQLTYEFPFEGGKLAWHCSEIPFVFHNIDRVPVCHVPGETDRLQEQICGAFVQFARCGDPNVPALPKWPACRPEDEATMIFDRKAEVRHNVDHELLKKLGRISYNPFLSVTDDEDGNAILIH